MSRFSMIHIVFVLALISAVYGQVPVLGRCPNVTTTENFDLQKYLGKWYEIEKYFAIFQFGGKCVTAEYHINSNGTVTVYNSQISSLTGMKNGIEGVARSQGRSDEAKLIVNFPSLPINFDAPYWILGTDYENYAVVWSCVNLGILSLRYSWILTRTPSPPVDTLEKAYAILDQNHISRAYFIRTDQKNCPKKY